VATGTFKRSRLPSAPCRQGAGRGGQPAWPLNLHRGARQSSR
jgi:hypothetical protein